METTVSNITELQQMVRESSLQELYSNITTQTDFYKYTHPHQYNKGVEKLFMYEEARIGGKYKKVGFFGTQMIIKENLMSVPSFKQLLLTRAWVQSAGSFDFFAKEAWDRVSKLGYVPIEIWALPEGTVVPEGTPLFCYTSTDSFFAKHLSLIEGTLMHNWAPTDIYSRFLQMKEELKPAFEKTGCIDDLPYSVLDFSYRSSTCPQDAVRKGTAFLMHFNSSDNCIADVIGIMKHYNGPQVLKSVWATEHSVALSFGPGEGEKEYLKHQLLSAPKDAIVSYLIDTWNSRNFMENVLGDKEIQNLIKERTGASVARPDSNKSREEIDMCYHFQEKYFGSSIVNGYKVLNNNNKVIWANDVDENTCPADYNYIVEKGWAAKNLVQGGGNGFMTKNISRDEQKIAIKPSMGIINGKEVPMAKTPIGSPWKASKAGHLKVYQDENGCIKTATSVQMNRTDFDAIKSLMVPVFKNGVLLKDYTYDEVQAQTSKTKDLF